MQAEIAQGRLVAVKLHAPDLHRPVGVPHPQRISAAGGPQTAPYSYRNAETGSIREARQAGKKAASAATAASVPAEPA